MNLGKLDHRLTLQAPAVVVQDEYGQPAPAAFVAVAVVWAQLVPLAGREVSQAAQLSAEQPARFIIRYRPDVLPTWRVLLAGTIYELTAVAEIGRRVGLTLTAVRRG